MYQMSSEADSLTWAMESFSVSHCHVSDMPYFKQVPQRKADWHLSILLSLQSLFVAVSSLALAQTQWCIPLLLAAEHTSMQPIPNKSRRKAWPLDGHCVICKSWHYCHIFAQSINTRCLDASLSAHMNCGGDLYRCFCVISNRYKNSKLQYTLNVWISCVGWVAPYILSTTVILPLLHTHLSSMWCKLWGNCTRHD